VKSEKLLRRRVAASAPLHRYLVEQLGDPQRRRQLAHQHKTRMHRHLLAGDGNLDRRRPPC
jgi:hypothetical protein